MSMCVTPSGASASMAALTTAGQAPIAPASPAPLMPSGLVAQGMLLKRMSIGGMLCARQSVIDERAGQKLTRLAIVDGPFEQRLADALGDSALHLTPQQERIDD